VLIRVAVHSAVVLVDPPRSAEQQVGASHHSSGGIADWCLRLHLGESSQHMEEPQDAFPRRFAPWIAQGKRPAQRTRATPAGPCGGSYLVDGAAGSESDVNKGNHVDQRKVDSHLEQA